MEWPYRQTEMNFRLEFSRSGKYLTTGSRIWGVDHEDLVWTCPSRSHTSWPDLDYRAVEFVQEERHIVIQLDCQYQIWDWKSQKKRATIFLLPDRHWAFYNHETGHYSGSTLAFRYLRFLPADKNNKQDWLSPFQFQKQTAWKNDPSKAGLSDFRRRPTGK